MEELCGVWLPGIQRCKAGTLRHRLLKELYGAECQTIACGEAIKEPCEGFSDVATFRALVVYAT